MRVPCRRMTAATLPPALTRFLAACMLAVVGLHAFAPIGTPLERRAGSAFSAATHDVSLAGKRKAVAQARTVTEPDGGRSAGEALPVVQPAPPLPLLAIAAPIAGALPPPITSLAFAIGPFGPRGPPLR